MAFAQNTPDSVPWLDNRIPVRLRIIGFVAIIFLSGLLLWSALALIVPIVSIIQANVLLEADMISEIALPLIGLIFGLYGWQSVRRYAFGHDDFRPRTSMPPRVLGQLIDIATTKPFHGMGSVQFTNSGIKIQAENATGIHIGLDILAALILTAITHLLFKRRLEIDLSYEQITEIKVVGR